MKTRRDRIPRAATLWPETIQILRGVRRRSPYVFTSSHATRYRRNARVNVFAELRQKASLPDAVKFNHLRGVAYTAACEGAHDDRAARVLAGPSALGYEDRYVLRHPGVARPRVTRCTPPMAPSQMPRSKRRALISALAAAIPSRRPTPLGFNAAWHCLLAQSSKQLTS